MNTNVAEIGLTQIITYYNKRFLRFGKIPNTNKSQNYHTKKLENGISVYEYVYHENKYKIIFPHLTYSSCVSLSGCIDRPCYLVEGQLVGFGSDGEPLITDVQIIKEVTSELYKP